VSLVIPTRATIPLGFDAAGLPGEAGLVDRLLVLPMLAGFTYLVNLLGRLFFYRRPEWQPVAYLLWISSALQGILLIVAVFILSGL
jgi:hypothetical protein